MKGVKILNMNSCIPSSIETELANQFMSPDNIKFCEGSATDRSQRRLEFQYYCKDNQNKILFTSNKKSRSHLKNSNFNKRLLKLKVGDREEEIQLSIKTYIILLRIPNNNHHASLSERRSTRSVTRKEELKRNQKYVSFKESINNNYNDYKSKICKDSDGAFPLKSSSTLITRNEISHLPDPKLCSSKHSPLEGRSLSHSYGKNENCLENQDFNQPSALICDIIPRKFSHISKLAKGLALNDNDLMHFGNELYSKGLINNNSKNATAEINRRRNSSKAHSGLFMENTNHREISNQQIVSNVSNVQNEALNLNKIPGEKINLKFLKKRLSNNNDCNYEKILITRENSNRKIGVNDVKPSRQSTSLSKVKKGNKKRINSARNSRLIITSNTSTPSISINEVPKCDTSIQSNLKVTEKSKQSNNQKKLN